jgi:hypothetical protein
LKIKNSANHNRPRTATHIIGERIAGRQGGFEISDCVAATAALPMRPNGRRLTAASAAQFARRIGVASMPRFA